MGLYPELVTNSISKIVFQKLTAGDLKKTNKNKEEEQFPLPNHAYPFYPTPFTGSNGKYVQQRIEYENILPRCKGKLSVLEWGEVSEEDRYTSRNLFIRTRKYIMEALAGLYRIISTDVCRHG